VGLYTSPHLITERERIRINFEPLSEELFAKYFFEVWDKLRNNVVEESHMPGYLQLLTLLSVHSFHREAVDMAIYEVHAGGRKDATNFFDRPVACGFTTIGLDHADLLGDTIQSIAWHKSGIMKRECPAFSIVQAEPTAKQVLETEAATLGCPIQFVDIHGGLPDHPNLRPGSQKWNASLAIHLVNAYLGRGNCQLSAADINVGTSQCTWPGRFQKIWSGSSRWFLDVAHNPLSLPVALSWFQSETQSCGTTSSGSKSRRVLIFGHESARNTSDLITVITQFCSEHEFFFDLIILSPYKRYGLEMFSGNEEHAGLWRTLQPSTQVLCTSSLQDAIAMASREESLSLITGSTYLVGEALPLLQER